MKNLVCGQVGGPNDCPYEFSGETPEGAMKALHPHYMEAHKDQMEAATEEDRKAWFATFNAKWAETPES